MRARSWNTELLRVDDRDGSFLARGTERDAAVALREDRVVAADARAGARPELRAALADDDHPRLDLLAVEELHAQPLGLGVATVLRRAETFLVCHLLASFLRGERRLERSDRALPVRVRLLVRERRLEHRAVPVRRAVLDLRDRQVGVPLREALRRSRFLWRLGLLRHGLGLRLRLRLRRDRLRGAADARDLDPRQRRAE